MKLLIDTTKKIPLREHLEGVVKDVGRMHSAAVHAVAYVHRLQAKPVVKQEEIVNRMTYSFVKQLELENEADLAVAMVIAAIDEVKQELESILMTVPEILDQAELLLDDHYCAGW